MAGQTNTSFTGGPGGNQLGPIAWPRYINALVAAWLFSSAFIWGHSLPLRQDTWIVGILVFVSALVGVMMNGFRWVNTVLAIWLFISTLIFPHATVATLWNNLVVACVVFVLSLIPNATPAHAGPR